MSDRFYPISISQLLKMILKEFENSKTIFGIPEELFFDPSNSIFAANQFGQEIDSPIGVAAGPHSQMAQNIIGAWLMGARYIELKTIQTLDELEISKPCIDMQDEGYNCEWSQELKIKESFNEYLNAWIIIHILNHLFGWKKGIGTIFNMSVGYNLEGVLKENVQWFFNKMENCSEELQSKINELKEIYPGVESIQIPVQISNNITLSTMHGCPADEIEDIAKYLLEKKKLHTFVKLNPTLLGLDLLREILNDKLGFKTNVPDIAFKHDLKYSDALRIINSLQETARKENLDFGLKLTNTLESINNKQVFGTDVEMMYMSGRALHPISVNVARKLQNDFGGKLNLSFSAGADAFNIANILSSGFNTVTVCTDILKPGGYMRLNQYFEEIQKQKATKVSQETALKNLSKYADNVLENDSYKRKMIKDPDIKTARNLAYFDCIAAPCKDTCATYQDIPDYLFYTSREEFEMAYETILRTNPFPSITGMVCDHLCQNKCTRVNYDNSLLIREVKRFISEQKEVVVQSREKNNLKVAIIGAGPSGLSCAYYLALAGFEVEVFESQSKAGGMVQYAIPGFRLTDEAIEKDFNRVSDLGVQIHYNRKINKAEFREFKNKFNYIFVGVGAQLSVPFKLEGIESEGVLDSLDFLFKAKVGKETGVGKNVIIIGGGNTAMDAARTAYRLVGGEGKVSIVYRRTINEMPADQGEIKAVLEEGMEIVELSGPEKVLTENGRVKALLVSRMALKESDASGRPRPVKIPGSEFEIECDTIIPAIGQSIDIDFIQEELLQTKDGHYETQLENIFIGGDAYRGAATAIKAIGDGRKAANEIIEKAKLDSDLIMATEKSAFSKKELMLKRAKRQFAPELNELDSNDRKNFKLVSTTLDLESVVKEAKRCLHCDEICNICTTVCPNFANYSYEIEPFEIIVQKAIQHKSGEITITSEDTFGIAQPYQILNIANFCNECGNCNTFCPTNSAPYKEKPKFWLTKGSYDLAAEGYFVSDGNTIFSKQKGAEVFLSKKERNYVYESKEVTATFSKNDFQILNAEFKERNECTFDSKEAIIMKILLEGANNLVFE